MGVDLGDLFEKQEIELKQLFGKTVAVDAHNMLYQFLSIIRQPDGTPLKDREGRVTSHLSGIIYRTTNLVELGIRPIFVFDGVPPGFKEDTIKERRAVREEAAVKWEKAKAAGDKDAKKYAQASSRLDREMVNESKMLMSHMGLPTVQAPSEGEAQTAYMVQKGDADYSVSQDYDSLLFGAPRIARNIAVTGRRKLPGKNLYVSVNPEIIELGPGLEALEITRENLIDMGLLVGTDFNKGIKGIGPKKALKLIKKHGSIEGALSELGEEILNLEGVRDFFVNPDVSAEYDVKWGKPDNDKITELLCGERDFSYERVENALIRLGEVSAQHQKTLDQWF